MSSIIMYNKPNVITGQTVEHLHSTGSQRQREHCLSRTGAVQLNPCMVSLWKTRVRRWQWIQRRKLFTSAQMKSLSVIQTRKPCCRKETARCGVLSTPCMQSWTWVQLSKSNPIQSINSVTQSNPIHNDDLNADPNPIQSIWPIGGICGLGGRVII